MQKVMNAGETALKIMCIKELFCETEIVLINEMKLKIYIKKILILCLRLNNFPFFIYSVMHYARKPLSKKTAYKIAERNRKAYKKEEKDFIIPTYDGSGQLVHPDIIFYENRYWLVVTPYPYGMEEYENPCIYSGESILSLLEYSNNPIAVQKKHEIGFHLSDPCLFEINGSLACGYRENTRNNGNEQSYLYVSVYDGELWGSPVKIMQKKYDLLLSPAFYCEDGYVNIVYVNKQDNGSYLRHLILDEKFNVISTNIQKCEGIPAEYYVWHIAITYMKGKKNGIRGEALYGLFLLKKQNDRNKYLLYKAISIKADEWSLLYEIKPTNPTALIQLHPYKSSFIPYSNSILYSYIDKKHRYRMTILNC